MIHFLMTQKLVSNGRLAHWINLSSYWIHIWLNHFRSIPTGASWKVLKRELLNETMKGPDSWSGIGTRIVKIPYDSHCYSVLE